MVYGLAQYCASNDHYGISRQYCASQRRVEQSNNLRLFLGHTLYVVRGFLINPVRFVDISRSTGTTHPQLIQ